MDLQVLRRDYVSGALRREQLADNPLRQFALWMDEAVNADIVDPTAMVVATASRDGHIHQRIVLLKGFDDEGFVFYTNYESRKARDIASNSRVSLHFPWHALDRQVIVNGVARKISSEESLAYFRSRPRESQLAAWTSAQSRPVASRDILDKQFEAISRKFADKEIPLPEFWGGYRVRPCEMEFWQGGRNRLHDRFIYTLEKGGQLWNVERLAP
jgi:pyridoxamine 5'-phosphate oxidase